MLENDKTQFYVFRVGVTPGEFWVYSSLACPGRELEATLNIQYLVRSPAAWMLQKQYQGYVRRIFGLISKVLLTNLEKSRWGSKVVCRPMFDRDLKTEKAISSIHILL